jgi:phytoene dehydrogenase-like protein
MFIAQLDQSPVGRDLIRFLMMSAWDVAHQWFEHPKTLLKALKISTESMVGPEERGTAIWMLLGVPAGHAAPGGLPVGGSGALADALQRAVEASGGTVTTDCEVTKITTSGGRATGVVLSNGEELTARRGVVSNVDPRLTLLKWVDEGISSDVREKIGRISEPTFSGLMIASALDEPPEYKASPDAHKATFVEPLPNDIAEFRMMFDDLRYGRIPTSFAPFVVTPTVHDPTRAPDGKHVLYLWHYEPYYLADGGPSRWDSIKEEVADQVEERYFSYTKNLSKKTVLKRTVFSPLDLERFNANLIHGAVLGPGSFFHQNFAYRPIPELGHYKTPVDNLYLCGMSTHPGGSISGGGRAAVQIIMQDLGLDFDDVIG